MENYENPREMQKQLFFTVITLGLNLIIQLIKNKIEKAKEKKAIKQ